MRYKIIKTITGERTCDLCGCEFDTWPAEVQVGEVGASCCEYCLARSPRGAADKLRKHLNAKRERFECYLAAGEELAAELEAFDPDTWRQLATERGRRKAEAEEELGKETAEYNRRNPPPGIDADGIPF